MKNPASMQCQYYLQRHKQLELMETMTHSGFLENRVSPKV